ncbi:MAG: recombinase family protein [Elainellaceae cyanobacterium]
MPEELSASYWVLGTTRSGKTARLIEQFHRWSDRLGRLPDPQDLPSPDWRGRGLLVFAATGDTRITLVDRIVGATAAPDAAPDDASGTASDVTKADSVSQASFDSTTPLGFFYDEVVLFWPLIIQQLGIPVRFPLRLRPETEQQLATRLWQPLIEAGQLQQEGISDYALVRRLLDLLQLAGSAAVPVEDIPALLSQGLSSSSLSALDASGPDADPRNWRTWGEALELWRQWCLERGLLTYGIVSDLYWRLLLPDPTYQAQLQRRYAAVLADDVDDYPAIAARLFTVLLDKGLPGLFTYNPDGNIRWGLGADAAALAQLESRCQAEVCSPPTQSLLPVGEQLWQALQMPLMSVEPVTQGGVYALQTLSRAALLRQVATTIAQSVKAERVQPQEVAIVGPGLDSIARYTLRTILRDQGIEVASLNDQQPLASSPLVRSLLTLVALVYPGLGRLVSGKEASEMLVILSFLPQSAAAQSAMAIDPVRAGLIVDHCFQPDPDHPRLLPVTVFPRWDRIGYQASDTYERLRQWIAAQQTQLQQRLLPNPATLLDRAIQQFLYGGTHLSIDAQSSLRELMETAQHYWDVDARLRSSGLQEPGNLAIARFIQLLRDGTITADPYPVRPLKPAAAVTLATAFQYRSLRLFHRWHFWLDVGSPLWLTGAPPLFGAPVFLSTWSGRLWTAADALAANQMRLRRSLVDLAGRAGDRIYLCHSDLSTSGQDQAGPLVSVVGRLPEASSKV